PYTTLFRSARRDLEGDGPDRPDPGSRGRRGLRGRPGHRPAPSRRSGTGADAVPGAQEDPHEKRQAARALSAEPRARATVVAPGGAPAAADGPTSGSRHPQPGGTRRLRRPRTPPHRPRRLTRPRPSPGGEIG